MVTSSSWTVPPSERRAQVAAQRVLNGAALLFDLATNAGEFGRGAIFEGAIGLNLVLKIAAQFLKVGDAGRELRDRLPIAAHGGGRTEGDLPPLGGAVDDEQDIANLGGLDGGAGDAGLVEQYGDVEQASKFEAATNAAVLADLSGALVLFADPIAIGSRCERGEAMRAER